MPFFIQCESEPTATIMPEPDSRALAAAIHVFASGTKDVDGRHSPAMTIQPQRKAAYGLPNGQNPRVGGSALDSGRALGASGRRGPSWVPLTASPSSLVNATNGTTLL